jgi:hypothetical protein
MVGKPAESAGLMNAPKRRKRSGMALPASLAAITAVSVLISGIWVIVDLNAKTSTNRKSALSALLIAEAGASHALGLLRGELKNKNLTHLLKGSNNAAGGGDDTLFIGYGLSSDKQIPAAGVSFGGGTYYVTMQDDPAETDGLPLDDKNNRILLRCRGVTPDGASAEIQTIVGAIPLPAIATEGVLKIGGNPKISGPCGGLHANEIIEVSGTPTIEGAVTASDTVIGSSCAIRKPDGTCNTPLHNQPPIDIPPLTVAQVCTAPTLSLLANGNMIDHVPEPDVVYSGLTARFGWKWGGSKWQAEDNPRSGTVCAYHDVEISKNWGSKTTPLAMSIYSTRSIIVSGNPYFTAHDTEGGLLIAENDLKISGNPETGADNYGGFMYAGAQCQISGNPRLRGQLLCKDNPNPTGFTDWVSISDLNADVSGNPEIIFDCTGSMLSKRKILSWLQRLGS